MSRPLPGKTLIVTCDYKPLLGGIATYLYRLADALAAAGCEIEVWSLPLSGDAAFDGAQRFATRRLGSIRQQGLNPGLMRELASVARHGKFSRIISGLWLQTGVASLVAARLSALPYYQICYGIELMDSRHSHSLPAKRWLRTRVLEGAAQVWAISEYTNALVQAAAPRATLRLLRPGVDLERFAAANDPAVTRERWAIGSNKLMLTVARLEDYKGIDRVLLALPAITAECPDLRYLIVGEGPDLQRLRSLAGDLKVLDRVTFTGRLDDAAVVALYQACDLFLMPSRITLEPPNVEGFGISFLEAAACGRPVIGGRSGGIPDAVIDGVTGLLVDPDDPEQIAHAALTILGDPGYARRLGEAGRKRTAARSWAAVGDTALALLAEGQR